MIRLPLNRELCFDFTADRGASEWLHEFARIGGLRSAPDGDGEEVTSVVRFTRRLGDDKGTQSFAPSSSANGSIATRTGRYLGKRDRLRFYSNGAEDDIVCDLGPFETWRSEYRKMAFALFPVYSHAMRAGGLPIHAALLELEGQGCLFMAPSGTGKTTCARRVPPPWKALGDDEALVLPTRAGGYAAYPFPTWSDYYAGKGSATWSMPDHVSLAGLFFIEQSNADSLSPLVAGEVALLLFQSIGYCFSCSDDDEPASETHRKNRAMFDVACRIAATVPGFVLGVSLTGSFWELVQDRLNLIGY